MDEYYEGMETIEEVNTPEEESETEEDVSLTTESPDWEEELRDEEVDEILGNDWTVNGELSADNPMYKLFKKRRKKGRRESSREEETEEDSGAEKGIETETEAEREAARGDESGEGIAGEVTRGAEPGKRTARASGADKEGKEREHEQKAERYQNPEIEDRSEKTALRGMPELEVAETAASMETEGAEQLRGIGWREADRDEKGNPLTGHFSDPYEKWERQKIKAKDLHTVPKDQSVTSYDSRKDEGIRNPNQERAGNHWGSDENIKHSRSEPKNGNGAPAPEQTSGHMTARNEGIKTGPISNFRSYQSLYDFYAYAGGRVFSKSAGTVKNQQGTVSEGFRELKNNKIVRFATALATGHGAASLYKSMRYTEKRIAEVAGKVESYRLSPEILKDKDALKKAFKDKKIIGITRHDILKYRKGYLERAEVRELLRGDIAVHKSGYSREDRRFINSQDFMAAKNPDRYAGVLSKYFRQNAYAFAEGNRLLHIGYRDLEKIMHHADNYGFHNSMDKKILAQLARVKKEKTLRIRAGKMLPGRVAGFIGMTVVEADPYLREIAGRFSRGYAALRLKKEMTARVSRLIGREVRYSFLRRAGSGIKEHIVSPVIRHVVKPVIRQTGKGVIKSVGAIRNTAKKAGDTAVKKAASTSLGRAYGRGKQAVKSHVSDSKKAIHNIGSRIAKTAPVKFTKQAGINTARGIKAGAKAGKKAAGYSFRAAKGGVNAVSRAGFILGTPFRMIGKVSSFLWQVRLKILMYAGGIVLGILGFLLIVFERILALQLVVAILSFDFGSLFNNIGANVLNVYENYIEYSDYEDMREDLRMLREQAEDTFQKATQIGNGTPEDDQVLFGHHIAHYGSPDKDRGYTIHFLDPSGNELASRSNNVKDIEALCAAMIGNQMGEYASYSRDLAAFDELLKDMYALMVPEITSEESEIYTCLYGCETFSYHCNDPGDYDRYYEMWEVGVGLYEDLKEYSPDEENCGGHSVPICFGHKDVDIYITLFDVEYAIAHNIYPENWQDRPYAKMIKEFVDNGAWTSEFYPMLARNFIDPDWHDAYGYDPDGGAGYSTGEELSDEDIEDILERMGDISRARQEILSFALGSVGKIPYYWGGKADCWGYEGNNFGAPVTADRKGRDKKGLDCSGFVQWVFGSVLGITIPRSTAGYAGYRQESYGELQIGDIGFLNPPGAESNHMGIYAGKDASGNDLWIHCSSSKGSTYGTYSFKYFCNIF